MCASRTATGIRDIETSGRWDSLSNTWHLNMAPDSSLSVYKDQRYRVKPGRVREPSKESAERIRAEPQEKHRNFQSPSKTEKPAFKETEQDPAKYLLTSQQPLKVIHSCQETSHIQRRVGQLLPFQRNKLVISAPLGLKGPYNLSWRNLQKAKSIYTLEENGSSTLKEQSLTGR